MTKNISRFTSFLVGLLALGALSLSYNALQSVAASNGLDGWQSYIWPLLLDFALIVFSIAVVRNSLHGERVRWPWFLVGVYTVATISFNLIHAPDNLTARVVAVVAPISLFLSFETLMAMLKSDVQRGVAAATLAQLTGQADQVRAGLVAAQQQTETMTAKRDQVQHELTELRKEKRNIVRGFGAVSDDTRSRAYDILSTRVASGEDISGAELGRLLGKAATTGRNLKKELWPIITGNGNGNTPTNGGSPQ
jgi:hypothetical protein